MGKKSGYPLPQPVNNYHEKKVFVSVPRQNPNRGHQTLTAETSFTTAPQVHPRGANNYSRVAREKKIIQAHASCSCLCQGSEVPTALMHLVHKTADLLHNALHQLQKYEAKPSDIVFLLLCARVIYLHW